MAESTLLDLRARSGSLRFSYGPCRIDVRGFRAATYDRYTGALTAGALADNVPFDLRTRAEAVRLSDTRDSLTMELSRLRLDGHLGPRGADNVARSVTATLRSGAVALRMPRVRVMLDSVALGLTALRMDTQLLAAPFTMPESWQCDARTLSFAPHSPAFLRVKLPGALQTLMSEWRVRFDASLGDASVRLPGFPSENSISGLDLTASFDSIDLHHVKFGSGDTRGALSARVRNLRQFLCSPVPAPLDIGLDLRLDTVQINQLARAYTAGHPGSAIARGDKADMAEGVDTVAMLIPRNLRARIGVSAMQTRYINLHLYDLMTRVRVADGRADIDTLRISSDFGAASMRYTYDTSDMQNMSMAASVDIEKINVVRFFQNFHRLLEMMPEMKNLSGEISARASAHAPVFPSMYLNVPSAVADVAVRAMSVLATFQGSVSCRYRFPARAMSMASFRASRKWKPSSDSVIFSLRDAISANTASSASPGAAWGTTPSKYLWVSTTARLTKLPRIATSSLLLRCWKSAHVKSLSFVSGALAVRT